jgi:uncharacterized protein (DUF58 family)
MFGFGLTGLGMVLFSLGVVLAAPAFWHPRRFWFMFAWDAAVLLLAVLDAVWLPRPAAFRVTRSFLDSPQLGQATRVELRVEMADDVLVDLRLVDDLHPALIAAPGVQRMQVYPRDAATSVKRRCIPAQRGDVRDRAECICDTAAALEVGGALGRCRACGAWTVRPQRVRVFPAHEDSRESTQFYLLRARQIEMQKRKLRLRGVGRDFESLRDYQPGDELRNVSWTATARRGKLVTRQFTVERSQQVWVVLDAGQAFADSVRAAARRNGVALRRPRPSARPRTCLTVTQLDQAATAATMLAQVINGSGDKFGMMAYGRAIQQLLPPGAGPSHLRVLIDLLSQTKSEAAEADALQAVARLKTLQRKRGLMVWVTELVDSAGRPELVTATAELVRRHLVVLVLLKHPELEDLAASTPRNKDEMFHAAAAQEMLERRRETILQLERQGVLIVETTAAEIGVNAVSKYLEVKAEGLL